MRFLEWRAGRTRDPVARLQLLQRKSSSWKLDSRSRPVRSSRLRGARVYAIAAAVTLTGAAIMTPWVTPPQTAPLKRVQAAAKPDSRLTGDDSLPRVWVVEARPQSDLYSNGLRVENKFTTGTAPRGYMAFPRDGADGAAERRNLPAGIVFHTTESQLAPFEEQQNRALRRDGEGLLEYVHERQAYHFVIDRFGRVFRIVRETDYANHAGNSVWADNQWIYVNLNQSFFGVAFEARSDPQAEELPINAAQVHAGRILVEMLRARYGIPAGNCVTHAQVSVNPGNWRAGYHTDWAAHLPFSDLGLSDNYARPLQSMVLFGFEADDALLQTVGPLQDGIRVASETLRSEADARNLSVERYRRVLHQKYRAALNAQQAAEP